MQRNYNNNHNKCNNNPYNQLECRVPAYTQITLLNPQ